MDRGWWWCNNQIVAKDAHAIHSFAPIRIDFWTDPLEVPTMHIALVYGVVRQLDCVVVQLEFCAFETRHGGSTYMVKLPWPCLSSALGRAARICRFWLALLTLLPKCGRASLTNPTCSEFSCWFFVWLPWLVLLGWLFSAYSKLTTAIFSIVEVKLVECCCVVSNLMPHCIKHIWHMSMQKNPTGHIVWRGWRGLETCDLQER